MKTFRLYDYLSVFYLTQRYGTNEFFDYTKYGLLWHEGEDYGSKSAAPEIRALHPGVVVRDIDTPKDNYGNYVCLWDDAQLCATWYCHLAKNFVKVGDRVEAGDVLGIMGKSGNVTGIHLHTNFVLTDQDGNRLYKVKKSNYGFLDPHGKVFPPGVEKYAVEWLKPDQNMGDSPELQECLRLHGQLVDETVTLKKELSDVRAEAKAQVEDFRRDKERLESEAKARNEEYKNFLAKVAAAIGSSQNESQIMAMLFELVGKDEAAQKAIDTLREEEGQWNKTRIELEGEIAKLKLQLKSHELSDQDFETLLRALLKKLVEVLKAR